MANEQKIRCFAGRLAIPIFGLIEQPLHSLALA
jgi:hypothetical protein